MHSFIKRRLHSFFGVFLSFYLIEHLFTNAKNYFNSEEFVASVNWIHDFPGLIYIEILVLGIPFVYHMIWGIYRLKTAETNSEFSNGTDPSLKYERNRAFTWQRITSWILLVGIIAHVIHMRVIQYPHFVDGQYVAFGMHSKDFGTATQLILRNTFQNIWFCLLYTLFVLSAVFHGMNGLWTALITWGVTVTNASQRFSLYVSYFLMALLSFWGLVSIWGVR